MNQKTAMGIVVVIIVAVVIGIYFTNHYAHPVQPAAGMPAAGATLSADAYPLYPEASWGSVAADTLDIGTTTLTGYGVKSVPAKDISDLAAVSQPFLDYYQAKLSALGWHEDLSLAAGGPGGDVTAYRKGNQYIVIGFRTLFKAGAQDEPLQCPCDLTLSVFTASAPAQ